MRTYTIDPGFKADAIFTVEAFAMMEAAELAAGRLYPKAAEHIGPSGSLCRVFANSYSFEDSQAEPRVSDGRWDYCNNKDLAERGEGGSVFRLYEHVYGKDQPPVACGHAFHVALTSYTDEDAPRRGADRLRWPTPDELARVEDKAKALVRKRFGVDPDSPDGRGRLRWAAREILNRD